MSDFDMISAMQKLLLEAEPPQDYLIVFPGDKAVRLLKEQDAMADRIRELESINADILAAVDQFLSDEGYSDEEVGGLLCPWISKVKEPPR